MEPTRTNLPNEPAASAALAVVEALYAFAEEPARWDDVIAAIDALPAPLDPARDPVAVSIMSHARRAASMLERLNAGRQTDPSAGSWDAVLLSSENRVRRVVGDAEQRLKPFLAKPLTPGEPLQLHAEAQAAVAAALAASREEGGVALAPFALSGDDDAMRCFGVALPRDAFPDALAGAFGLGSVWAEPLNAIVLLSTRQLKSVELGPRRLGLTAAEARLASKLVQGLAITDAARELGISAHTARTQLKAVFAKTGARRQSELIRLITDVSRFSARTAEAGARSSLDVPPRRFVTLADGRQLFYREYGAEGGPPVLYFHVGLAASLVIPDIAHAASKHGVRLIAFERPGFGQSTPRADYTFETVAADAEDLLRRLNIRKTALFGDGYGGGFAVAAARRMNGAVRRLALRSPSLGRPMSNESTSVLAALFRQPWIIPALAELMHRGIRLSLVRALLRHYGERAATDAARAQNTASQEHLEAAICDAFERTGAGLSAELTLFASGARADPGPLTCPIAVWHGDQHPGIPVSESIATFAGHPRATLHVLPGVGSYLGPKYLDDILAWLAGASDPYPT